MSDQTSRSRFPSQMDIFRYWGTRTEFLKHRKPEDEPFGCLLISPALTDADYLSPRYPIIGCFACGRPDAERAHIIARAEGGSDDVSNIHLLCGGCHTDSELLRGEPYWTWIYGVRRRSYMDHYAIRFGYPDFEKFSAAFAAIVLTGRKISPNDLTAERLTDIQSMGIDSRSVRDIPDDLVLSRLSDAGFDVALGAAVVACRASNAGGLLRSFLQHEIRNLIVRAWSVRAKDAAREKSAKGRSPKRGRIVSDEEKMRRRMARQERIDRIALEYGHILLEMEGTPPDRIIRHMEELDVPSPFGRGKWSSLAVKSMTARYRELI